MHGSLPLENDTEHGKTELQRMEGRTAQNHFLLIFARSELTIHKHRNKKSKLQNNNNLSIEQRLTKSYPPL